MDNIVLNAPGKVNLSLDVLRRKDNGYHELSMIMQEISLKDIVTINSLNDNNSSIEIICDKEGIPLDEKNIVHRAITLLKDRFNIDKSVRIFIEKNIPLSGGLAGGSTDAASTLKGLNTLWDLNLTDDELMGLGLELGADVPFFINGGTAHASGIGERLITLPSFKDRLILIANPGIEVSTRDVFESLVLNNLTDRPEMDKIISYIESGNTNSLSKHMKNVLESVTIVEHPVIGDIKSEMIKCGALGSLMSGSGASVFGIFDTVESLEKCKVELEKTVETVISTVTI